jgi:outer membrane protein assembly factor BamB
VFRAVDLTTGREIWATHVRPDPTKKYYFHGDALVTAGAIVVGADEEGAGGQSNIHAFDRATGQQKWKYAAGGRVLGAIAGLDSKVFAAVGSTQVVSLDLSSGQLQWTHPSGGSAWNGPAAAANRVFTGDSDGSLFSLSADTGRVEWRVALGAPVTTSVTLHGTDVYVGTGDGVLHRVDSAKGAIRSSRKVDEALRPASAPVIAGDSVVALLTDRAADYRAMVSLDLGLDRIRWRQDASTPWSTSRVLRWRDTVIVGTPTGEIAAYCRGDGSPAWSHVVPGRVRVAGASGEILYIGTVEGTLHAVRPPVVCPAKSR